MQAGDEANAETDTGLLELGDLEVLDPGTGDPPAEPLMMMVPGTQQLFETALRTVTREEYRWGTWLTREDWGQSSNYWLQNQDGWWLVASSHDRPLEPGYLVMPAEPRVGMRWTSAGVTGAILDASEQPTPFGPRRVWTLELRDTMAQVNVLQFAEGRGRLNINQPQPGALVDAWIPESAPEDHPAQTGELRDESVRLAGGNETETLAVGSVHAFTADNFTRPALLFLGGEASQWQGDRWGTVLHSICLTEGLVPLEEYTLADLLMPWHCPAVGKDPFFDGIHPTWNPESIWLGDDDLFEFFFVGEFRDGRDALFADDNVGPARVLDGTSIGFPQGYRTPVLSDPSSQGVYTPDHSGAMWEMRRPINPAATQVEPWTHVLTPAIATGILPMLRRLATGHTYVTQFEEGVAMHEATLGPWLYGRPNMFIEGGERGWLVTGYDGVVDEVRVTDEGMTTRRLGHFPIPDDQFLRSAIPWRSNDGKRILLEIGIPDFAPSDAATNPPIKTRLASVPYPDDGPELDWAHPGAVTIKKSGADVLVCWPPNDAGAIDTTSWQLAGAPARVLPLDASSCALAIRDYDAALDPAAPGGFALEATIPGIGRMHFASASGAGDLSAIVQGGVRAYESEFLEARDGGGLVGDTGYWTAGGILGGISASAYERRNVSPHFRNEYPDPKGRGMWAFGFEEDQGNNGMLALWFERGDRAFESAMAWPNANDLRVLGADFQSDGVVVGQGLNPTWAVATDGTVTELGTQLPLVPESGGRLADGTLCVASGGVACWDETSQTWPTAISQSEGYSLGPIWPLASGGFWFEHATIDSSTQSGVWDPDAGTLVGHAGPTIQHHYDAQSQMYALEIVNLGDDFGLPVRIDSDGAHAIALPDPARYPSLDQAIVNFVPGTEFDYVLLEDGTFYRLPHTGG